jgi:hypothetical protein
MLLSQHKLALPVPLESIKIAQAKIIVNFVNLVVTFSLRGMHFAQAVLLAYMHQLWTVL